MVENACRLAYEGASLLFLGWLLANLVGRTRDGLMIGITTTTFALCALPFGLLPVRVPGHAIALGMAGLTALRFLLLRPDSRSASRLRGRVPGHAMAPGMAGLTTLRYPLLRPDSRSASRLRGDPYIFVLGLMAIAIAAFLLVGDASAYGRFKAVYFVLDAVIPVLAFAMLSPLQPADLRLVFRTLVGCAILTALAVLGGGVLSPNPASVEDLGNPIPLSRTVGLGVVVLLLSVIGSPRLLQRPLQRLMWLGLGLSLTVVIPILGSRGALLAAFAAITCVFLIPAPQRSRRRRAAIAALLLAGLSVFALLRLHSGASKVGLTGKFSSKLNALGVTANDVGRLDRLRVAASALFTTNAIGLGTGGFAAKYASLSGTRRELAASHGRDYPHNIFFELAAELGAVGLIFAIAWLVVSVKGLARVVRPGTPEATLLVALWVYALVNACVSGDLVSNAAVLVFGALPWLVADLPVVRPRPSTASTSTVPAP